MDTVYGVTRTVETERFSAFLAWRNDLKRWELVQKTDKTTGEVTYWTLDIATGKAVQD